MSGIELALAFLAGVDVAVPGHTTVQLIQRRVPRSTSR